MNSAVRILELMKNMQRLPKGNLGSTLESEYNITVNEEFLFINFLYRINIEIKSLEEDLIKIGKIDKYRKDITRIKVVFSPRPKSTPNSSLMSVQELSQMIIRLEGLEDLLEAHGVIEDVQEYTDIEIIINEISVLIEKFEDIDDNNYISIINLLKEVNITLSYYQINGIMALEEALEKLFCKGSILSKLISKEVQDDIGKVIGHIYGIWVLGKKYGNKSIEFAKKRHDLLQKNEEEFIEAEVIEE